MLRCAQDSDTASGRPHPPTVFFVCIYSSQLTTDCACPMSNAVSCCLVSAVVFIPPRTHTHTGVEARSELLLGASCYFHNYCDPSQPEGVKAAARKELSGIVAAHGGTVVAAPTPEVRARCGCAWET